MYNKRKWLNKDNSMSTGAIVIFDGKYPYSNKKPTKSCFVEFSDCHQKVRVHKSFADSSSDWMYKIDTLIDELTLYKNYLEQKLK